jgi:hypothetical protein
VVCIAASRAAYAYRSFLKERIIMGKYLIGWLLGVPAIVLVIIYFLVG